MLAAFTRLNSELNRIHFLMHRKKYIFKLYFSFVAFDKPLFVFDAETNENPQFITLFLQTYLKVYY